MHQQLNEPPSGGVIIMSRLDDESHMTAYEAKIEVTHDCPYCHLTARFPGAYISVWCNSRSHVIEVNSDSDEELAGIEEEFLRDAADSESFRQGRNVNIIMRDCDCEGKSSVSDLIEESGCWYVPPSVFHGGWEYYKIMTWRRENVSRLVRSIEGIGGTVKLVSIKPLGEQGLAGESCLTSGSIVAGLTGKQIDALAKAYQMGYFETPARIDADAMAKRVGLSRSTFAEHLRKAESKVLFNIFPILQMVSRDMRVK
ncbi:MAG: helix-turn-helix domain-containing protein [Methanomassiliicoccales archaeon]|nr:helix-turn-helix domain-containing protein [Methanomassiliicoccales archaeon]